MLNLTVTVPDGSSNHGNPHLLCTPPSWSDYLVFYASNYFAHAATVITDPGQGTKETISVTLAALLLPVSGLMRALVAMRRHSRFEPDLPKRAVRAGALYMVVKVKGADEQEESSQSLQEGRGGVELSLTGNNPKTPNYV
jgi:hypothetical protein